MSQARKRLSGKHRALAWRIMGLSKYYDDDDDYSYYYLNWGYKQL